MSVKIGDRMPEGKFKTMSEAGPKDLTTAELFSGKKVVLFSVPGAFTPTCDAKHLPGFIGQFDALKSSGLNGAEVSRLRSELSRTATSVGKKSFSTTFPNSRQLLDQVLYLSPGRIRNR